MSTNPTEHRAYLMTLDRSLSTEKILLLLALLLPLLLAACHRKSHPDRQPEGFTIHPISPQLQQEMEAKNVFGPLSPMPIGRLRLVRLKYIGFDGQAHDGELVTLDACAPQVQRIFQELYARRFPLEKVQLLTAYDGNDDRSMAANNTSCHNCRPVTNGKRLSLHAYGTAIDINPLINPYLKMDDSLGIATFSPPGGIRYANRLPVRPGKATRLGMAEEVVEVFARHGFYGWGGYWDTPIDYQHFQVSRPVSELLAAMPPDMAKRFFARSVAYYNRHKKPLEDVLAKRLKTAGQGDKSLAEVYRDSLAVFEKMLGDIK